ncbi:MAG: hypothetical protein FD146_1852 [Anaerolineaceae bacterium]|nr:MAG: hypothetical protein FD146_1852 [Anaerolineaceae bacterium]
MMANALLTLPPDYWTTFTPAKKDLEFIGACLFENETPLTEKELVPVLVNERIRSERDVLLQQHRAGGKTYLPKENYKTGDPLVFPALNWKKGKVIGARSGVNPGMGEFSVIEVEFEDGVKSFAAGLAEHALNQPVEVAADDQLLNPENVLKTFGADLEQKLLKSLHSDPDLVRIAGRWFPRALLVDVNAGHLNLAEAVLEENGGAPLTASALIEQVELPLGGSAKLIEFSMNYALQEDGRFDEVGPAGEVLWCLKRLEPEDVQQIPATLRCVEMEYDQSLLTPQMLKLVAEIDDELTEPASPAPAADEVTVALTYPHWRAGTLPVSARVQGLFPTAYESPRVRFTLVDGQSGEEIPAWVVRQHRYVAGLGRFYKKYDLFPGSLVVVKRGKQPGQAIITARTRRPTRDWVRTVLAGSDGGIVFAMLKQNLAAEYNERMVVAVPDAAGVDEACAQLAKQRVPFEQLVASAMREVVKLNVQGHVHAQELYSALNIIRRCPPAPLLAFLVGNKAYKHVGDMHFRMAESEAGNE